MLRLFLSVSLAVMLAGCATQFGTRTLPFVHHRPQAHVSAPVVVAPAAPAPVAPETFKKRWLHKFFIQRATEK